MRSDRPAPDVFLRDITQASSLRSQVQSGSVECRLGCTTPDNMRWFHNKQYRLIFSSFCMARYRDVMPPRLLRWPWCAAQICSGELGSVTSWQGTPESPLIDMSPLNLSVAARYPYHPSMSLIASCRQFASPRPPTANYWHLACVGPGPLSAKS